MQGKDYVVSAPISDEKLYYKLDRKYVVVIEMRSDKVFIYGEQCRSW